MSKSILENLDSVIKKSFTGICTLMGFVALVFGSEVTDQLLGGLFCLICFIAYWDLHFEGSFKKVKFNVLLPEYLHPMLISSYFVLAIYLRGFGFTNSALLIVFIVITLLGIKQEHFNK